MVDGYTLVPVQDILDLLGIIHYDENITLSNLLTLVQEDLLWKDKQSKPTKHLRALNYFCLHKKHSTGGCSASTNIIKTCLNFFLLLSENELVHRNLLSSIIGSCLDIQSSDNYSELSQIFLNFLTFLTKSSSKFQSKDDIVFDLQDTNLPISEIQVDEKYSLTVFFIVLEKCCLFFDKSSFEQVSDYELISDDVELLIKKLIKEFTLEQSRNILRSALPVYIASPISLNFLGDFWLFIDSLREEQLDKQLFYLCLLSQNFISLKTTNFSYPLFIHPSFWSVLQLGVTDINNYTNRKFALHLLRKYVNLFSESGHDFDGDLFFWHGKIESKLNHFWNQLFLLFEILEEKQVHLVIPVLKNLPDLNSFCQINPKVSYSWLFCVFQRVFAHTAPTVVQWGLPKFCSVNPSVVVSHIHNKKLLFAFFEALNNIFFYNLRPNPGEICLQDSLGKWLTLLSKCDESDSAFPIVLDALVSCQLSPVPFYFISEALSNCPAGKIWNVDCLNVFNKLLIYSLKSPSVYIRSAIQCRFLSSLTHLSQPNIDLYSLINILGNFNGNESLARGSGMWNACVEWLSHYYIPAEFVRMCSFKVFSNDNSPLNSNHICARGIVLLFDCNLLGIHDNELNNFFDMVFDQFEGCEKRVYADSATQDQCVEFLMFILIESNVTSLDNNSTLLKLVKEHLPQVLSYIECRIRRRTENLESVKLYIQFVEVSFSNFCLISDLEVITLYRLAISSLSDQTEDSLLSEYLSLAVINIIFRSILLHKFDIGRYVKPFECEIVGILIKYLFDHNSSFSSRCKAFKGKLSSCILEVLWSIFHLSLPNVFPLLFKSIALDEVMSITLNSLSEAGNQTLIPILKSSTKLLPLNIDSYSINIEIIEKSWTACFELRKSDLFWTAINEWIKMVFVEDIISRKDYRNVICKYASEIFARGEELVGLVDLFTSQLLLCKIPLELSFILRDGLLFGPILRKDRRIEYDVCEYIEQLIEEGSLETFGKKREVRNDKEVRMRCLKMFMTSKNEVHRNSLIFCVISDLIKYDSSLSSKNKKHFNNSIIHRKKQRILQSVLILENYMFHSSVEFGELPETLFQWTFNSLISENQQPSVRYQLEWLFVRLILHYPPFLDKFWIYFDKAKNERVGSLCSFISISYLLAFVLKCEDFSKKCFQKLLPWCMAQNFNIRLYSQVVLSKLWDICPVLCEDFGFIKESQWTIYDQGNLLINAKKMLSDFYFNEFHPVHSFSLETIFWDLPRLSNISPEEWIPPKTLHKYGDIVFYSSSQTEMSYYSLAKCEAPTWISKTSADTDGESDARSLQKKFIPWKGLPENDDISKCSKGGLILVTSLIEKAANLGGLARTCEIFAVKELVLPSLEIMNDKEFISLSMTAEKHLFVTEVKAHNLPEYLKIMKNLGYSIIGLEQTSESTSLGEFNFLKDCVLLLGNEREGIPANLMPLLDYCVEIPQMGLIRSLNVHVSGALFLWEYSKQHLLNTGS